MVQLAQSKPSTATGKRGFLGAVIPSRFINEDQ